MRSRRLIFQGKVWKENQKKIRKKNGRNFKLKPINQSELIGLAYLSKNDPYLSNPLFSVNKVKLPYKNIRQKSKKNITGNQSSTAADKSKNRRRNWSTIMGLSFRNLATTKQ